LHGSVASRAVASPNPSSSYWSGTCTHTSNDGGAWWKVELGGTYAVAKVEVLGRGDCCGDYLNGFSVMVDDTVCATNVQISTGDLLEVACVGTGSSVTISLPASNTNPVILCGVRVSGIADQSMQAQGQGDPHFFDGKGGHFDFRGVTNTTYSMVSTPTIAANVRFEDDTFLMGGTCASCDTKIVHGSFMKELYIMLTTDQNVTVKARFSASNPSRAPA